MAQDRDPTLRNGPVVTPRPPARSAGRYSREGTEELRLLSRRNSSEPPAPSGAARAVPCDLCQIATRPRRDHLWVRARAVLPRPGVPRRGRCRPKVLKTGVPRRGHYRLTCLTRPPAGWHRRLLTLPSHTPQTKWCYSGNRRLFPCSGLLRRLS